LILMTANNIEDGESDDGDVHDTVYDNEDVLDDLVAAMIPTVRRKSSAHGFG